MTQSERNADQEEQIEYIRGQINKIINSEEDRQYRIAWQTINEVSKRKSASRAVLGSHGQKFNSNRYDVFI